MGHRAEGEGGKDGGAAVEAHDAEFHAVLMDHGIDAGTLDEAGGGGSFEAFKGLFERELEVSRKQHGLAGAGLVRAVAECVPGGRSEAPLEGLETMSCGEMDAFCSGTVLPAVKRCLERVQERLRNEARKRRESEVTSKEAGNAKYRGVATFGGLQDFYKGIAAKIGLPNPRLMEGMEAEHCQRGDAEAEFSSGNYGTTTTPAAEWGVVTDPTRGTAASVGQRRVRPLEDLMRDDKVVLAKLRREEVLALQLYTGPMFVKYNAVLRGFPEDTVTALEGNTYTTTIYCIVSGVIKLSKIMRLPADRKVYRGLMGLDIPEAFTRPDEFGVRGGVEFAMLSTTLDRSVALHYAGSVVPTIFEIGVGAIDRGASLVFLSQYPHEEEILLPPRSYLEVVTSAPRVEAGPDGRMVRVVELKCNANLASSTIEEIESRRRDMFLSSGDNALQEVRSKLLAIQSSERVARLLSLRPTDVIEQSHVKLFNSIMDEAEEWLAGYKEKEADFFNEEFQYARARGELTALPGMALNKYECWIEGTGGLHVIDLIQEKMEQVSRRMQSEMTRMLMDDENAAAGGDVAGNGRLSAEERGRIALELCKRRGVLVSRADEVLGVLEEPAIVSCAAKGDVGGLGLLLSMGCDVDARAKDGSTALHRASQMGYFESVRVLVDAGATVGAVDGIERSSLHIACEMGHTQVVRFLLTQGGKALTLKQTVYGETCAHVSARMGHLGALRLVCEAGGEDLLLIENIKKNNCAHIAASRGHMAAVALIAGFSDATVAARGVVGLSCAAQACHGGREQLETLRFLAQRVGGRGLVFALADDGRSCAYIAARNGSVEQLAFLHEVGGDELLSIETNAGRTCALGAAKHGHLETLRFVAERMGRDFLTKAAPGLGGCAEVAHRGGHAAVVEYLAEWGITPDLGSVSPGGEAGGGSAGTGTACPDARQAPSG